MLTDAIEVALTRKLDDLTRSVIEHPDDTGTLLPRAAQQLADSAPLQLTPETTRQLRHEVAVLQHQVTEIRASSERLQQATRAADAREAESDQGAEQTGDPGATSEGSRAIGEPDVRAERYMVHLQYLRVRSASVISPDSRGCALRVAGVWPVGGAVVCAS